MKFFVKNTEKNTVETFDTFEKIYTNNIYFDKTEQKYIPKKDEMYTKELYQNVKEKYAINFATRLMCILWLFFGKLSWIAQKNEIIYKI